ncbi:MAG TPA: hypothetical protein V6D10_15095 [Trichocoleus sp.]
MTQEPSPPKSPASPSPAPSKLGAFTRMVGQLWGIVQPIIVLIIGQLRQLGQWLWDKWWNWVLPQVQKRLPDPWNTRLSKPILTAITASILAIFLWLPNAFSAQSPSIAEVPDPVIAPTTEIQPAPPPTIAPDRLAKIQERLTQVAEPYGEALVQTVQPSLSRSRLTVKLAHAWYQLAPDAQDQLSNELLKRSQQLKFSALEIQDAEGTVLARSPVVGSKAIVLQRHPSAEISPV